MKSLQTELSTFVAPWRWDGVVGKKIKHIRKSVERAGIIWPKNKLFVIIEILNIQGKL